MGRQLPGTVVNAVRVLVALVVFSGVVTLLMWVRADDLILSWGRGNAAAREILEEGGLAALRDSPTTPAFVPVAVVSFVMFAMLAGVLLAFFVEGYNWARVSLTATLLFGVLVSVLGMGYDLPGLFVGMLVVTLVLCLADLFFLWHPATNAFIRGV
jgi:hypothetical protein